MFWCVPDLSQIFLPIPGSWSGSFLFLECPYESFAYLLSCFSHIWLFVALWTVAYQAPLSMGFSRPEYWSGLPLHSLGDLPNPGIETKYLASPALAGGFFTTSATLEAPSNPLSSVQLLSHVRLSVTPWTAARQSSLSITSFRSLLKLMSIELVMPSNHLILCYPLFLPP